MFGVFKPGGVCSGVGSSPGSYIRKSSNMNPVKAAACNPNDIDYFCEKNSISQCEKKCLAFRGLLHSFGYIFNQASPVTSLWLLYLAYL